MQRNISQNFIHVGTITIVFLIYKSAEIDLALLNKLE